MLLWVLCSSVSPSGAVWVWVSPHGMPQHHCSHLLPPPLALVVAAAPGRQRLQPLLWGQAGAMVPGP